MATDFTIADVLAWARTKPADAVYCYTDSGDCALCQFLRETGRAVNPSVGPWLDGAWEGHWSEGPLGEQRAYPKELEPALRADGDLRDDDDRWTFGNLVKRLEKLCPDTVVTPSEWTKLDAYMEDIEATAADFARESVK